MIALLLSALLVDRYCRKIGQLDGISCHQLHCHMITRIIIEFPYNERSDWLKQRASSENRTQVDDGKVAFKFLLRNCDKFDQIKHLV